MSSVVCWMKSNLRKWSGSVTFSKRRKTELDTALFMLPDDALWQVLQQLTCSSIMRLRTVSKQWFRTIKENLSTLDMSATKTAACDIVRSALRFRAVTELLLPPRRDISDLHVLPLLAKFRLTELGCDGNTALTDALLYDIAEHCPDLEYLYLKDCAGLTDAGIVALHRCTRLRYLDLRGCRISNSSVIALSKTLVQLNEVHMGGDDITDLALLHLANNCSKLTSLSLHSCWVTDAGLQALAQHKPDLGYLSIRFCEAVSDAGLRALSTMRLKELELAGLDDKVTDNGLVALVKCSQTLRRLTVSHCPLLHNSAVGFATGYIEGRACGRMEHATWSQNANPTTRQ